MLHTGEMADAAQNNEDAASVKSRTSSCASIAAAAGNRHQHRQDREHHRSRQRSRRVGKVVSAREGHSNIGHALPQQRPTKSLPHSKPVLRSQSYRKKGSGRWRTATAATAGNAGVDSMSSTATDRASLDERLVSWSSITAAGDKSVLPAAAANASWKQGARHHIGARDRGAISEAHTGPSINHRSPYDRAEHSSVCPPQGMQPRKSSNMSRSVLYGANSYLAAASRSRVRLQEGDSCSDPFDAYVMRQVTSRLQYASGIPGEKDTAIIASTGPIHHHVVARGHSPICKSLLETLQVSMARDWNAEWQVLLHEQVRSFRDLAIRMVRLSQVEREFVSFAKQIAVLIVEETSRKDMLGRRILPVPEQHGVAGGLKYRVGNCFFKFAVDAHGLYGSDASAAKAACNEIRAANAILDCNIPDLHLTLSALFYVRGQCVMATACYPINAGSKREQPHSSNSTCESKPSLVYGSDDGGRTVHADDPTMNGLMERLAKRLGLREHVVIEHSPSSSLPAVTQKWICTAGDVEGHIADDGRMYLLDLARFFPPVPPRTGSSDHLFKQFRPEFMANRTATGIALFPELSPDAFSRWGVHDAKRHHADVHIAFNYLVNEVIPQFAEYIAGRVRTTLELSSTGPAPSPVLPGYVRCNMNVDRVSTVFYSRGVILGDELHLAGVNIRYMGYVLNQVPSKETVCRQMLLRNMFARTLKVRVRRGHSLLARKHQQSSVYVAFVAQLLHTVLSDGTETVRFCNCNRVNENEWEMGKGRGVHAKEGGLTTVFSAGGMPYVTHARIYNVCVAHKHASVCERSKVLSRHAQYWQLVARHDMNWKFFASQGVRMDIRAFDWQCLYYGTCIPPTSITEMRLRGKERCDIMTEHLMSPRLRELLFAVGISIGAGIPTADSDPQNVTLAHANIRGVEQPLPFAIENEINNVAGIEMQSGELVIPADMYMALAAADLEGAADVPTASSVRDGSMAGSFSPYKERVIGGENQEYDIAANDPFASFQPPPLHIGEDNGPVWPALGGERPVGDITLAPASKANYASLASRLRARRNVGGRVSSANGIDKFPYSPTSAVDSGSSVLDRGAVQDSRSMHMLLWTFFSDQSTSEDRFPDGISEDALAALRAFFGAFVNANLVVKSKRVRQPDVSDTSSAINLFSARVKRDVMGQKYPRVSEEDGVVRMNAKKEPMRRCPGSDGELRQLFHWVRQNAEPEAVAIIDQMKEKMISISRGIFHPLMVLTYVRTVMNATVVDLVKSLVAKQRSVWRNGKRPRARSKSGAQPRRQAAKKNGKSLNSHLARSALLRYAVYHRLLLEFATRYPLIRRHANQVVMQFARANSFRHKTFISDLGEFLINLHLSDMSWSEIAIPFLEEMLCRNVRWALGTSPELSCVAAPSSNIRTGGRTRHRWWPVSICYRRRCAWHHAFVGLRIVQMQVHFLLLQREAVADPSRCHNAYTSSIRADDKAVPSTSSAVPLTPLSAIVSSERATELREQSVRRLQLAWMEMVEVQDWSAFFRAVLVRPLSVAELDRLLCMSVTRSEQRGYHKAITSVRPPPDGKDEYGCACFGDDPCAFRAGADEEMPPPTALMSSKSSVLLLPSARPFELAQ